VKREPWGLLFVNLGSAPDSGLLYLEVPVPSRSIEEGDELEIPDMHGQLLTQPKLMIHNKTKSRLLLVDHHMDPAALGALEPAAPAT
jgi:hypothetical protein